MDDNKKIIEQFKLLSDQVKLDIDFSSEKDKIRHMFRLASIQKVIKILEKYKKKIISSEQLKGIKGIGKKSLLRIDEILKTGKLSEVKITKQMEKHLKIIEELENVFGLGRKTAYKLFKHHDIKSIDDLKKKYEQRLIDLPENVVKGLEYFDKIKENIPREEIDKLAPILVETSLELDYQLFAVVCGSYRRENKTSNDIDVILCHTKDKNYLTDYVRLLKKKGIIIDALTSEEVKTKFMGICKTSDRLLRRIDIRFMPYESFYSAILYFTGSKDFNRKMRQVANSMDYILNEYGLFDEKGKMLKVKSEKDIFDLLGMEYLSPNER